MPAAIESINLGFLLDGKWRNDGERIEIYSPGTRQRAGVTYRATAADAEAAIQAAARAFEITRRMGGYERQRVLRAISSGIEKDKEDPIDDLFLFREEEEQTKNQAPLNRSMIYFCFQKKRKKIR